MLRCQWQVLRWLRRKVWTVSTCCSTHSSDPRLNACLRLARTAHSTAWCDNSSCCSVSGWAVPEGAPGAHAAAWADFDGTPVQPLAEPGCHSCSCKLWTAVPEGAGCGRMLHVLLCFLLGKGLPQGFKDL